MFAADHGNSLLQNVTRDTFGRLNLGTLMFLRYARIVPMHVMIVACGSPYGGAHASPCSDS